MFKALSLSRVSQELWKYKLIFLQQNIEITDLNPFLADGNIGVIIFLSRGYSS